MHLHDATRRMKKWVDKDSRDAKFDVGDMVFPRISRESSISNTERDYEIFDKEV